MRDQCVKRVQDFGATHYHDICAGTVASVPWGSADWAVAIGLIAFIALLVGGLLAFAAALFWDLTR